MHDIRQIEVWCGERLVGRLALGREGLCLFEYAPEWLRDGFSISPFELPLRNGVIVAKARPFEGGFGVFDDCLPDGWGGWCLTAICSARASIPVTCHSLIVWLWSVLRVAVP